MSTSSSPQKSSTDDAPHYAEANIVSEKNTAGGSTSYSMAAVCLTVPPGREGALEEFPRDQLTFKEKLGEGQFGEVRGTDTTLPSEKFQVSCVTCV